MKKVFAALLAWLLMATCAEASLLPWANAPPLPYGPQPFCTYYVDSINGSNSNAGTSYGAPLKDLTSLPTILAYQTVCLKRGSSWRQDLTISAAGVTVRDYGTGALPILDASDVVPNATLVKTGGQTNVYNTPSALNFTLGGQSAWANMWETGGPGDGATGRFMSEQASIAAVDANACSYYVPSMTTSVMPSTGTVYIRSCDGTNPINNGYTYEIAQRTGLQITGPYGVVMNIEARKNANNNGSIVLLGDGGSYTVSGVIARNGGKHNLYVSDGSTVTGSTIIDGYYPTGDGMLVFNVDNGANIPVIATGNIFQMDQLTTGNGGATAVFGHANTSGLLGPATINGNWFISKNSANLSGISFVAGNVGALTVNGNYFSQTNGGVTPNSNLTLTNNQFVSDFAGNIAVAASQAAITMTMTNNKFCSSNLAGSQGMIFLNGAFNDTVSMTNNLLYIKSASTGNVAVYNHNGSNTTAWTLNGNDFGSNVSGWYAFADINAAATIAGDNNIYENGTFQPNWNWRGVAKSTLATWKSAVTPADANATQAGNAAVAACTLPTIPVVN